MRHLGREAGMAVGAGPFRAAAAGGAEGQARGALGQGRLDDPDPGIEPPFGQQIILQAGFVQAEELVHRGAAAHQFQAVQPQPQPVGIEREIVGPCGSLGGSDGAARSVGQLLHKECPHQTLAGGG